MAAAKRCFERASATSGSRYRSGWRVARFGAIDSTNEEARRRAFAGDPGRLWIVAGRADRRTRPARPRLGIAAGQPARQRAPDRPLRPGGCATIRLRRGRRARRARRRTSAPAEARLKWPNDLVRDGAKCAGLLVEGATLARRALACVVGIGVNCAQRARGLWLSDRALTHGKRRRDRPRPTLFERLVGRFERSARHVGAGRRLRARFAPPGSSARRLWAGASSDRNRRPAAERATSKGLTRQADCCFAGRAESKSIEAADLWILAVNRMARRGGFVRFACAGKPGLND